jgi:hypothetical protein
LEADSPAAGQPRLTMQCSDPLETARDFDADLNITEHLRRAVAVLI